MKTLKTTLLLLVAITLFNCKKDDNTEPVANPTITTISPTNGPKTTIVTINGQDFGTDLNNVTVFFNDVQGTVQAVTNTQITAVVPARAFTGTVKVVVNGQETEGPIFTYIIIDIQVSTFAGSGVSGDVDGQGTNAQFNSPNGIVMDTNGNLFVADGSNNKIRKITPSGVVSTFAGSGAQGNVDGQGVNAQFRTLTGITIDNQGNLFVADYNQKIRKITPSGVVSTFAGSGVSGDVDGQGISAQFFWPDGITIDNQGNLFVADSYNQKIRKITPSGVVSTFAGNGSEGDVDGTGASAQFGFPAGIAIDNQGNLFVADYFNSKIRKITPSGVVSTFAGNGAQGDADGQGANAQFNLPSGIAIDNQDNLFVADAGNNKIRKITPSGVVSTFAGSGVSGDVDGTGASAQFHSPESVLIDDNNDIYVADRNHKIRKITQE